MGIFQKSVIQKCLSTLDKELVEKAFQQFRGNYSPAKIEKIKLLKEEEYQDGFLRDLFVNVLGYTLKPDDNYNLAREFKNLEDAKKADGAILKNEKAIAVIELKSTKTKDLKSITEQAFNYKNNQPDCKYVITSNFQKLRFYIDYANEFEEFDLFHLQRPDFELLYLILNKNSIFSDLPLTLKEETRFHEQNISNKLYNDYSIFKNRLFENLIKNNPENDKLTLFKKSQKLLDRFLFILFAEDSGLLPPNSISRIVKRFEVLKEEDAYKPIYDIYKQYFGYMNIGRKGKTTADDIPAYNGGLFYPDESLDNLIIDDEILIDDLLKLSEYDFNTEVDVNILGHIFEHSLSEIEEITAEIEGTTTDKSKSKRKKDGVFYTPKYITQYIVENTIGTLCNEKRKELGIEEIEFDGTYRTKDGNLSVKGKKLYQKLNDYKNWLLSLKIVDPACGSGAFLNQALNFLIREHKNIDDIIAELTNTALRLFDTEKSILENNLFGVDINEESVEIAKLSLWLRTAQKGRKLSVLSNNIKCGNSLIDDPEVAGKKAFDWQKEFPEIMQNGGFDVVIGNPPYVNIENLEPTTKKAIFENYVTAKGRTDLYIAFIELSFKLTKHKGLIGIIIPFAFTNQNYGELMRRKIIEEYSLIQIVDISAYLVFADAMVKTIIVVLSKEKKNKPTKIFRSFEPYLLAENLHEINQKEFLKLNKTVFETKPIRSLLKIKQKLDNVSIPLEDICLVAYGVRVNSKTDKTRPKSFYISDIKKDSYKQFVEGKDISRYWHSKTGWLNYQPKEHYNSMFPELFENEKLMFINVVSKRVRFSYDNENLYNSHTVINCVRIDKLNEVEHISAKKILKNNDIELAKIYDTKFILALVNSSLLNWYFFNFQSEGLHFYPDDAKQFPIIKITKSYNQKPFIIKVDKMLELNKNQQRLLQNFIKYIQYQFNIENLSKKIESWHELEFSEFTEELNKIIKKTRGEKLTKKDEMEWMELFEEKKADAYTLKSEIEKTDKEIDQMVYELYGLTDEEIAIIENSIN